ncbi:efflux RND transporter periplasmic adaptor subunit [Candidatus Peribacteria bacterium]|nr:efflux RND transporter periplasmic adaptor subunit [Candidatus Peribacteria bacterium]
MKLTDVLTKAKAILMILRRRWKRTLAVVVIAIPVLALANFLVSDPEPEYLTDTVEKGTLTQTVEAVATVISEKDLELKFPVSGIVDDVLVSEGDTVISLQELAKLRSGSLQAAVTAAQARLTTAYAELRLLQEGTRPEDIAIAEAELRNKQSSLVLAQAKFDTSVASLQTAQSKLTVLKQEAQIALAGEVATAESTILKELTTARASLSSVEDVFEDLTLQNIIVQEQPATYFQMETLRRSSEDKVSALINNPRSVRDYNDGLSALQEARTVIADASTAVQLAFNFISGLEPQGLFSYTKKETLRTSISTEKTDVSTSLDLIVTAMQSLQDKSASFDTKIAAEEANVVSAEGSRDQALKDINTFQTAVEIAQAQLELKKAGSRKADIDAAYGRVQSAKADLEKAQADFDDTILRAPIDGTITKVNLKKGEFTPGQFSETVAAITILGVSPYRIEIFASEIDIPKVKHAQVGELILDAYPNRVFTMSVAEIDPAATIVDGVPKYRIKLDFAESVDDLLKIGMTGDLDIITDAREDVLFIPGRAVIKNENDEDIVRVLKNGKVEERQVSVGMETVTDVEILTGLQEGETVIVLQK